MKQIAHRIDENLLGGGAANRIAQFLRHQSQVEAKLEGVSGNTAKTLGKGLGIAVLAARTHLGAAPNRVPGGVGPFDFGIVGHVFLCSVAVCAAGSSLKCLLRGFDSQDRGQGATAIPTKLSGILD